MAGARNFQQMLAWHFVDGHGGADDAGFGIHHREALDTAFLQLEHVIGKVFPARKNIAAHQGICLVGIDDGIEEHCSAAPGLGTNLHHGALTRNIDHRRHESAKKALFKQKRETRHATRDEPSLQVLSFREFGYANPSAH